MTDSSIKSARRVFEIMEYFDLARTPLSLKQICDRYDYPASSGAAILKSLVMLGYLEYDKRSRTYLPTMRIAALGSWVVTDLFGGMNIIGLMETLRDETRETVILAAQSDLQAQYVHVIHSHEALQYTVSPGTLRPLANSGFGRLLLSVHTDHSIRSIVRRIDAARLRPDDEKIDLDELMSAVNLIRENGYACSHNLVTQGVGVIGVLLPETPFRRIFAIGLGGPSERIMAGHNKHLSLLQETVAKFAEILK